MKGYLTVFLSLSLGMFISIFLGLINGALQNLGKLKFECAVDIGMNSVLGEFHRELLEQYDLLFVDISYGQEDGNIANIEGHLKHYIEQNLHNPDEEILSWNEPMLKQAVIPEYIMASDEDGMIMRQQACAYMRESEKEDAFRELSSAVSIVEALDSRDEMVSWEAVMTQISAMSLPLLMNEFGEWEEVALENPADVIFESVSGQLGNLIPADGNAGSWVKITTDSYLSHRRRFSGRGTGSSGPSGQAEGERNLFQTYLFDKCGTYRQLKSGSLLEYQVEYLIFGENTDYNNLAAVAKRIFKWKFADNTRLFFSDTGKYNEAKEAADSLLAVSLKPEFQAPVLDSILYAWAFQSSIYDTAAILQGGRIPLLKSGITDMGTGLDYRRYLWLMLSCEDEITINLRSMDIMEMDIRQSAYNQSFRMDWCLESYRVHASAADSQGAAYEIERKYGYY